MSLISINNLTFSYEGNSDLLFSDLSFMIDTDWRLGLVGRNGRGKTTLLKLISGQFGLEYRGRIASSVSFDYFPFTEHSKDKSGLEVISSIAREAEAWQISRELSLLEVDEGCLERSFELLSGGEQVKILLAALFLKENNFLLIDEPTNNLDLASRQIVSKYLRGKKGFILVSHDRQFIDGCVDHVLSINRVGVEVTRGNLSVYLENKARKDAFELSESEKLKGEIARLSKSSKRSEGWSQKGYRDSTSSASDEGLAGFKEFHRKKAGKLDRAVKQLERRVAKSIEEKSSLLKNIERADELMLRPLIHHSNPLLELREVTISRGGRSLFAPQSFSLYRGERLAILGKNGSGKSSLIKLILGELECEHGSLWRASGLKISYVSQKTDHLRGSIAEFVEEHGLNESKLMTLLSKLDFSKEGFSRDIERMSSGQKKKLLIAKSLCEEAHLYIWDEPLGYIDLLSRIQLENLLLNSEITLIFIEHDQHFMEKVATKTLLLS